MKKLGTLSLLFFMWSGRVALRAESFFSDPSLDAAVKKQVFAGEKMTGDDLKNCRRLKPTALAFEI